MYKVYWSTANIPTWNSWFIPECIDAVASSKGNGSSLGVCLLIKECATKSEEDLMKKENDLEREREREINGTWNEQMNRWTKGEDSSKGEQWRWKEKLHSENWLNIWSGQQLERKR